MIGDVYMSLTRYDGVCFRCGRQVKAGKGDFQIKGSLPKEWRNKIAGKWLIRCFDCKLGGNKPLESSPFYKLFISQPPAPLAEDK